MYVSNRFVQWPPSLFTQHSATLQAIGGVMNEMVNQVVVPSLEFLKVGAPSVLGPPTVNGIRS